MPSPAHEQIIVQLKSDPELLRLLVVRLLGKAPSPNLELLDSALRQPAEVRPDLLFKTETGWLGLEVQLDEDAAKARRWLLMAALLVNELGMGDLMVLTHSHAVARWCEEVAALEGEHGCQLRLRPVPLVIDEKVALWLLDPAQPALCFFAAWAMQDRHGDEALAIVQKAGSLTDKLPARLRSAQLGAILNVLNRLMLSRLESLMNSPQEVPESPAFREFRERMESRAEARAEARMLLRQLGQKGFVLTEAQRQRVQSCTDSVQFEAWIDLVLTAKRLEDVLGPEAP